MITDENKKLAQWAMDYALKNGCQAAKVLLYSSSNTSFELRDAKMDRLQQAFGRRIKPFPCMWTDVTVVSLPTA